MKIFVCFEKYHKKINNNFNANNNAINISNDSNNNNNNNSNNNINENDKYWIKEKNKCIRYTGKINASDKKECKEKCIEIVLKVLLKKKEQNVDSKYIRHIIDNNTKNHNIRKVRYFFADGKFPNNPTALAYSTCHLLAGTGIIIISNESYKKQSFGGKHSWSASIMLIKPSLAWSNNHDRIKLKQLFSSPIFNWTYLAKAMGDEINCRILGLIGDRNNVLTTMSLAEARALNEVHVLQVMQQ